MNWLPREIRIILAVVVLGAIGLVIAARYTDICRLQAVTINGQAVTLPAEELGLRSDLTIFQQPLDSLADVLLAQSGIRKVDIAYSLPNGLRISTNDLTPVCMMLNCSSGLLYALDETGRVLPLDKDSQDWVRPVITGASVRRLFDFTSDLRVGLVVPQLERLGSDHGDVYRMIREVDFSRPDYLTVSVSGLPCAIKVPSDRFQARMDEFIHFMEQYDSRPYTASAFDLRYDDMIIRVAQDTTKKKSSTKYADASQLTPDGTLTLRSGERGKPSKMTDMKGKSSAPVKKSMASQKTSSKAGSVGKTGKKGPAAPQTVSKAPSSGKAHAVTRANAAAKKSVSRKPAEKSKAVKPTSKSDAGGAHGK
jgi:hypothetical protein